jgi:hypothetical protein
VGTFDGATYKLYVDGALIWTSGTFGAQRPQFNELILGADICGGSQNYFDGIIDEVSIYRQVLTPEQVDALYRSNVTSLHFPFDEPPGAGQTGGFANLVDLRGLSNATCAGAACPASGVYGRINQALQFDGVDDYVTLSDVDLSGDFAIAAWFKTPNPADGTIKPLISKQTTNSNPSDGSAELNFQIEDNGNLKFFMSSDSATCDVKIDGGVLAADRWYHAVVVMQNNDATLYLNGAPVATDHFDGARRNSSLPLLLGASNPGPHYFRGKIDDLRAFSKALSPSEIQALYQSAPTLMLHLDEAAGATTFSDASGNGLNGHCDYCPQAGVKGQIGTAVEFKGERISIPDNPLLDLTTFSVGAWVKPDGPKNGYQPLIVKDGTSGGSRNYGMFINPNALTVLFSFQAADCTTWRGYSSHNALIQNTWNHVMMTYDGAKFNFYLNGNLDRSESVSGVPCQNNGDLVIDNSRFTGRIDEVTIYRRALSSYEIRNAYLHQSKWVEERQTFHLTVDAEDPVSTLRSTEPRYRANRDVVLNVGALDATSHVTGVEFGVRRAGQASFTWTPAPECMDAANQAAWCPTFDPTTLGGEGRYELQTRATDFLEHVETPAAAHTFYVDDTPPNAAYTGQALLAPVIHPAQENTLLVPLSGTASDPNLSSGDAGSGAAKVYVALLDGRGDVAGAGEVQTAVTNGQWQVDYIFTNRDFSGAYTLRVTSEDAVGNRQTETLTTIAIDASPSTPDMNLTGVPQGAIVTPLTLQGDVSEWPGTGDATLHLRFEEAAGATSFLNSAGGGPATCSGAYCPTAGQSGQLGSATSFDGPRWQYLSLPHQAVNNTNDGTIATWLYLDRRDEETIFSRWTQTPSGYNGNLNLLSVGYTGGVAHRKVAGDDGRLYFAVGWNDDSPRLQSNAILNTGQWYYVAVVFSDSEASFYINGVLDNTANGDFTVSTSSGSAQLGKWMGSTLEFLDGKLDDTRVYNRALSGKEINLLAQTTFGGVQGVDVAIRSTTPGSSLYNQAPPAGQILHLPFDDQIAQDGALSFWDISGGNHTGTCSGDSCPAVGAKGRIVGAAQFDGANDHITINNPNVPTGNENYTLAAWIKPDTMGAKGIVGWGNYGHTNQVNALRLTDNGIHNYWWWNDLTVQTGDLTGAWHHVAATFDGDTRIIYLDGVERGRDMPTGHNVPDANNLTVGKTFASEYFDGALDDVRVLNRALSAAEIRSLYIEAEPGLALDFEQNFAVGGSPLADDSGWEHSATLHTGANDANNKAVVGQVGAYALHLDGVDDHITINNPNVPTGNENYTLAAWIKPDTMGMKGIVGWGNYGHTNQVNALRLTNNGIHNYWWWNDLTVQTGDLTGDWHHVAATFDGATRIIYLDGVERGRDTPTGHNVPDANNLTVGKTSASEYFDGALDDVRVYPRALSAEEIAILTQSGWHAATLAQSGSGVLHTTWSYTVPEGLEGSYTINLRGADALGNVGKPVYAVWSGEIDTLAPRLTASYDDSTQRYNIQAQDYNQSTQNFNSSCGAGIVSGRQGFQSPWYLALAGQTPSNSQRLYQIDASCAPPVATDVGRYHTPGSAVDVAVSGNYAYVADLWSGLRVVDISNPALPRSVGWLYNLGNAVGVAVSGNYAYVSGESGGLYVVNIATPSAPTLASSYDTPGSAQDVAISGNYAYLADYTNGLLVIDISNPSAPGQVGRCDTPGAAIGVAVSGHYAYVADRNGGLRVVNISNPSAPYEVGHYGGGGYSWDVLKVAVSSNHAYLANRWGGLYVVNVANPGNPTLASSYSAWHAEDVAISGNRLYIAGSGLRMVDISNPGSLAQVGVHGSGATVGVAVTGGYAYVVNRSDLQIIQINLGSAPPPVATACDTGGHCTAIVPPAAVEVEWHTQWAGYQTAVVIRCNGEELHRQNYWSMSNYTTYRWNGNITQGASCEVQVLDAYCYGNSFGIARVNGTHVAYWNSGYGCGITIPFSVAAAAATADLALQDPPPTGRD